MLQNDALEIAVTVDSIIKETRKNFPTEDSKSEMYMLLVNLSVQCYDWGSGVICNDYKYRGRNRAEIGKIIIEKSQEYWNFVSEYCKNIWEIQLHPLGMLSVLKQLFAQEDGEFSIYFLQGIEEYAKKLDDQVKTELTTEPPKAVPDIDSFNGDVVPLVLEYFRLMEEIGTFYNDRDKYETEEQKELHDRIMAIFEKIGGM